ncbi:MULTISPECIES: hypothetical protein [Catenuloplanes]|uniref:Cytochrome bd-type quinol oxidase subunit 2 n=1 Tax=Catenuloplanes niger TaxID=587534 RepID=A0AAE3ZR62_9ACTN|nr:hypothetical protein [Catenuloplanes niger]MDR7324558.1 cytochrome bd-type quinol oxidase subunit 2 [Catenuloplanes niger]
MTTEAHGMRPTGRGPGRVVLIIYCIFALAAGARAGVQIATKFGEAPLAYALSAVAAVIYLVAAVALSRNSPGGRRVALVAIVIELVGVVVVGLLSVFDPAAFPDATVWSNFGQGYGYVPLVLPLVGLFWLHRTRATTPAEA